MTEQFDSWQGFIEAGFAEREKGVLKCGGMGACCVIRRGRNVLECELTVDSDGSDVFRRSFDMPLMARDFFYWAALFSRRAIGSVEALENFNDRGSFKDAGDLYELLEFGFEHEDELPDRPNPDASREIAAESAMDETSGKTIDSGRNLPTGFAALIHDFEVRQNLLWEMSRRCAAAQDLEALKRTMDGIEQLKSMIAQVGALSEQWRELDGRFDIPSNLQARNSVADSDRVDFEDSPTDEEHDEPQVEEDVEQHADADTECDEEDDSQNPKPRSRHCSNFSVTFPDGTILKEDKASTVFALAIEKFGAERVSALGLEIGGDPVVTREASQIRKMPRLIREISDGWIVKTHSNTYTKMQLLERMAASFGIELTIEKFFKETAAKSDKPSKPGRRIMRHSPSPSKFQIGRVVKWFFPKVFELGRITDEEIELFLSVESKRKFGTRGFPVLKETFGAKDDYIVNGQRRYYADIVLERSGRKFLLTSQFVTENSAAILDWIGSKGFHRNWMERIGRGEEMVAGLFPEMPMFAKDPEVSVVKDK